MPRQTLDYLDTRGILGSRPTQADRGLEIPRGASQLFGSDGSPSIDVPGYYPTRSNGKVAHQTLRDAIVRIASAELTYWQPSGRPPIVETDPQGTQRIRKYATGAGLSIAIPQDAWSAVFISYCIRTACQQSGVVPEVLTPATYHTAYAREAYRRRQQKLTGYYWAYTPTERAPQVGDIIYKNRSGSSAVTFADIQTGDSNLPSHGDIVSNITNARVTVIGGNVSERVRDTHYRLQNGGLLDLTWNNNGSSGIVAILSLEPKTEWQEHPPTPPTNQARDQPRGPRGTSV